MAVALDRAGVSASPLHALATKLCTGAVFIIITDKKSCDGKEAGDKLVNEIIELAAVCNDLSVKGRPGIQQSEQTTRRHLHCCFMLSW